MLYKEIIGEVCFNWLVLITTASVVGGCCAQ